MGIYGHKFDNFRSDLHPELLSEAVWKVKESGPIIDKIKRDKNKIEKIINRICKESFESFCNSLKGHYEKDAEEFRKGKPPVVNSFEQNTDYVEIQLKYFSGWNDTQLFFQDYIIKKLNSDPELKPLGYHFTGEDYLGIYIHPRRDSVKEEAILEASAKELLAKYKNSKGTKKYIEDLKSNSIHTPTIVKNHIKYTIRVPQEIKDEGKKIADILKSEYSKLQNSKEFKDIVKDLKDSGKITAEDAKHKLTDELIYEVDEMNNVYVLNITLTSPMSQDMFYEKASNGKALYNLVDPLFNKLKSDNRIKGSKYFYFMNDGDDFYACDVMLKICDSKDIDDYLVEIKIK